jgi:hypothetical protein
LEKILSSAIIQIRGMFHDKKGVTGKYFWTKIGRLSRTVIGN